MNCSKSNSFIILYNVLTQMLLFVLRVFTNSAKLDPIWYWTEPAVDLKVRILLVLKVRPQVHYRLKNGCWVGSPWLKLPILTWSNGLHWFGSTCLSLRPRPLMIWGGGENIGREFFYSSRKPFSRRASWIFFSWRRAFEVFFSWFSPPHPDH